MVLLPLLAVFVFAPGPPLPSAMPEPLAVVLETESESKRPRWSDKIGAYVLTFGGRVTMPSVKNFQLVDPRDESDVICQFGKVDDGELGRGHPL